MNCRNLHVTNYGDSFFQFDIKDTKFTFGELFTHFYKDFMALWKVSVEEVEAIINKEPRLKESDFFDYYTWGKDFLVKKNALYSEKWKDGSRCRTYFNVYVGAEQFRDIYLDIVIKHIMQGRYPMLYKEPFAVVERKYPESVKAITSNTLLQDICEMEGCRFTEECLTAGELVDILVNGNADAMKLIPTWKAYCDGNIFFKVGDDEGHIVYVEISDLQNHDWQAVLDRVVYSIKDKNGKLYNGRQENAPYMDSPIVKEIERFVKEC